MSKKQVNNLIDVKQNITMVVYGKIDIRIVKTLYY